MVARAKKKPSVKVLSTTYREGPNVTTTYRGNGPKGARQWQPPAKPGRPPVAKGAPSGGPREFKPVKATDGAGRGVVDAARKANSATAKLRVNRTGNARDGKVFTTRTDVKRGGVWHVYGKGIKPVFVKKSGMLPAGTRFRDNGDGTSGVERRKRGRGRRRGTGEV